jgi:hypothetical protein
MLQSPLNLAARIYSTGIVAPICDEWWQLLAACCQQLTTVKGTSNEFTKPSNEAGEAGSDIPPSMQCVYSSSSRNLSLCIRHKHALIHAPWCFEAHLGHLDSCYSKALAHAASSVPACLVRTRLQLSYPLETYILPAERKSAAE